MKERRHLIVVLPLRRLNCADKMAYEGQHGNETAEAKCDGHERLGQRQYPASAGRRSHTAYQGAKPTVTKDRLPEIVPTSRS
jgi:hypothetical protein